MKIIVLCTLRLKKCKNTKHWKYYQGQNVFSPYVYVINKHHELPKLP